MKLRHFSKMSFAPVLFFLPVLLVADARSVVANVAVLKARAKGISGGLEPELSAVVDVLFPIEAIAEAALKFREQFPHTPLRLYVEALGGAYQPVIVEQKGRWIAYISDETGHYEIYVRPFAGKPAAPEGKIRVSNNGGDFPVWGPAGHELFYMSKDGAVFGVNTSGLGKSETIALPARLFRACPQSRPSPSPETGSYYESAMDTHDGKQFLVNCWAQLPGKFTVLMNWSFPQ